MKKLLLAGALLGTLGIGAFSVYADSGSTVEFNKEYGHMRNTDTLRSRRNSNRDSFTEDERNEWFNERQAERSDYREERIQLALAEGWITEEEAAERRVELTERDRLFEENGFSQRNHHRNGMRRDNRQRSAYHCH